MMLLRIVVLCLAFTSCLAYQYGYSNEGKKVLLTSVQSLTLHRGQQTTGRRSSPVPQLKCVGGSAQRSNSQPDVVQCYNKGNNGQDVQWKCDAELPSNIKFGRIQVTCEGYDEPNDPYILQGSCGLEYNLEYTGNQRGSNYGGYNQGYGGYNSYNTRSGSSWGSLIMLIALAAIAYGMWNSCARAQGGRRPGYGGGPTGGGFPGGHGGPPGGYGNGYNGGSGGPYNCNPQPPRQYGRGGNGFWGGMATGGMLGYLLGGGRRYGGYGGYNRFGGYGGYRQRPSFGSSWGSSGGSFGGGSRRSSGFGGTSRR